VLKAINKRAASGVQEGKGSGISAPSSGQPERRRTIFQTPTNTGRKLDPNG